MPIKEYLFLYECECRVNVIDRKEIVERGRLNDKYKRENGTDGDREEYKDGEDRRPE